jgi:hypothetical protein
MYVKAGRSIVAIVGWLVATFFLPRVELLSKDI